MDGDLRDVFAALATIGLLVRYGHEGYDANEAYEIADKLLSCREPEVEEAGIAKLAKKPRKRSGS
jgi:hypothetical protein